MLASCSKCLRTYENSKSHSVTLILCLNILIVNPDGCCSHPSGLVAAATHLAFNMIPNVGFGSSLDYACNIGWWFKYTTIVNRFGYWGSNIESQALMPMK